MKNIKLLFILSLIISLGAVTIYKTTQTQKLDCIQNTKDFLSWYKQSSKELEKKEYNYLVADSDNNFKIDFDAERKYVDLLQKSGYFSDVFIDNMENYFKKADIGFRENKESADNTPGDFNFDLVLASQEAEYIFGRLPDQIKIETKNSDRKNIFVEDNVNLILDDQCKIVSNGTI